MQLSTSFLPFDVAPAPAAASAIAAPGASAQSHTAPSDFGAILASEASVPSTTAGKATTATPSESTENNSSDSAAADHIVGADSPDLTPDLTQTTAIAAGSSWSGFVTPPVTPSDISTSALAETSSDSDVPTSVAEEGKSTVNPVTTGDITRAAVATNAQPQLTRPASSAANAQPGVQVVPPTSSPYAAGDEAPLDSSSLSLPPASGAVTSQPASPSLTADSRGSSPVGSQGKEVRPSGNAASNVASPSPSSGSSRTAESSSSTITETPRAETGSTALEQPQPLAVSNAASPRSSHATVGVPSDARALNRAASAKEPSSVADEGTEEADAAPAVVSEKRVRPSEDTAYLVSDRRQVDHPRIGDHTVARAVAEKFAAPSARRGGNAENTLGVAKKESLTTSHHVVAEHASFLGTNVAKAEDHMPVTTSIAASAPPIERLSHAVSSASFDATLPESGGEESAELAQVAHRAVKAAMEITEQFAAGERNSVTLKFSVSGSELGVRVELRGEQVHTTFRTDSPELRAALAQEWQAVNAAPASDRASRLAEPVFTSNASTGAAGSDTSGADQRGSQARQGQFASDEWARYRTLSRAADAAPAAVSTPVLRAANLAAPGRLHTFA